MPPCADSMTCSFSPIRTEKQRGIGGRPSPYARNRRESADPLRFHDTPFIGEKGTPEMTVRRFTLIPGWIDTAGRTRTWKLVDARGQLRAEMTCKRDAETVVESLCMADLLIAQAAKTGMILPESLRGCHGWTYDLTD